MSLLLTLLPQLDFIYQHDWNGRSG